MLKDYFKMAWNNFSHRKLRTFLTLIGIFVGIAAVVSLISLSQGFQNFIHDEFKTLGADKIIINPSGSAFGPTDNNPATLTKDDVKVIRSSSGVKEVTYYKLSVAKIEWGRDDLEFQAIWTYPLNNQKEIVLAEELANLKIIKGRDLKNSDTFKAVVGYDYANYKGYKKNLDVGDRIKINDKNFKIVGIHGKIGNPSDDRAMIISENAYIKLFNKSKDEVSSIIARVEENKAPKDVVKNIERNLRKSRNVKEGEEDFEVTTFEDLIKSFLKVFAIIEVVLVGIASISLVVGGVGIMNTMYTSVVERTKDIGVMKAIGAKNSDILKMFLIESGLIGLTGGILGVLAGLTLAKIIEFLGTRALGTELLKAATPWWLIFGALAFAFILGTLFGVIPAKQASKMNPVDALRTE